MIVKSIKLNDQPKVKDIWKYAEERLNVLVYSEISDIKQNFIIFC